MTEAGGLKTAKMGQDGDTKDALWSLIAFFSQPSLPWPWETTQPHTLERVQDGEDHSWLGEGKGSIKS